jgi:enamine deaminase RidA (YjgF/YER057c/UK114 family)
LAPERFSSGTPWEDAVGYSRAVRAGPFVFVSGTTATGAEGELLAIGDAYEQTRQALRNIEAALARADAGIADVVQTRIFVTDITRFEQVGRAHAEVFGGAPPAASMVEVARLVDPRMLVEIEAVAHLGDGSGG